MSAPTPAKSAAPAATPVVAAASVPASPAPAAVAAAAATPAAAPAAASVPSVADARKIFKDGSNFYCAQTRAIKSFWNESIAKPTNAAAISANVHFQKARAENGPAIIGGVTALTFLASLPFGRFAVIRNTLFGAVAGGLAVNPALTIGTLALARDRLAASAGLTRPTTVVVQTTPAAPADKKQ